MSLLRRHRDLRDVPDGDVITQTEPETDAEGGVESTEGKTDQPTGEDPTPAPESPTEPKPEAEGGEGLAVVETSDGVQHVGVLPESAAVPAAEEQSEDEPAAEEPKPHATSRKRSTR